MLRAWFNSIQSIFSAAIDFLNFPNVGFNILAKMRITTLLFKFDWKSQRIKIDCLVVVGTEMLERTDESSIRFYKSGWHRKWKKKSKNFFLSVSFPRCCQKITFSLCDFHSPAIWLSLDNVLPPLSWLQLLFFFVIQKCLRIALSNL